MSEAGGLPFRLRLGTAEQFARLRRRMVSDEYTTSGVCERLKIPTIYHFVTVRDGRTAGSSLECPLDLWIRMFLDAEPLAREQVLPQVGEETLESLVEFGLVRSLDDGMLGASVLLYPTESMYIVSDLAHGPLRDLDAPEVDDAVYPAITKNTQQFLSTLPTTRCERLLDLCSGTGIAALVSASLSDRVWAVDITERSKRFADFNAMLNGAANLVSLQGDLYHAVAGMTFDRIVAHPPYVPATEQQHIFKDGGQDGEQVTRGIIGGLPEHLEPGGRCYCTCVVSERAGVDVETRVREMLGEAQSEFDLAVVTMRTFHPMEHYGSLLWDGRLAVDEFGPVLAYLRELEIDRLVYSTLVLQRRTEERPTFTVRRRRGEATVARQFEWLLEWETWVASGSGSKALLDARLVASPDARLTVANQLRSGDWVSAKLTLSTQNPFELEAACEPWAALLLARSGGQLTVREQLRRLKDDGEAPPDASEQEFEGLVRALVAGGFLHWEEHSLPTRHEGRSG